MDASTQEALALRHVCKGSLPSGDQLLLKVMGERAEADAAFRRSFEALDTIQCPPELAQTLLAYGRFRKGDTVLWSLPRRWRRGTSPR